MLTKVILSSLLVNFGKDILIKKSEKVLTIKKVVGGIGLNMAHNGWMYEAEARRVTEIVRSGALLIP